MTQNGLPEQLPPQAIEMEQSVLGSMLQNAGVIDRIAGTLQAQDFYHEAHRHLYRAMLDLHGSGTPVDTLTVDEWLKAKSKATINLRDVVGSPVYLAELVDLSPTAAHVEHHAEVVRQKSQLRAVIRTATDMLHQAHEADDAAGVLDAAEAHLIELRQAASGGAMQSAADGVKAAMEYLQKLANRGGGLTGLATGFADLDRLTGGLQAGNLVVIAGRPSMGKTTLALNMAAHAARDRHCVGVFSLEMTGRELWTRLLASPAEVNSANIRTGDLSGEHWKRLNDQGAKMHAVPLHISDSTRTVAGIRAQARRLKAQAGSLALIVVDYLQLLNGDRRTENRQQEVAAMSRALKALAVDLDCPVVALSQLNRESEKREGHRPRMGELRESGGIEQDADVVMLLYRDEVYNEDSDDRGVAEVNVAKQRNGPTGTVKLTFRGEYTRFDNLAKHKGGYGEVDAAGNPLNPPR